MAKVKNKTVKPKKEKAKTKVAVIKNSNSKSKSKKKRKVVIARKPKKGWLPLNKFDFTRTEYEYFLAECPFTEDEKQVFDLRRRGKSIIAISLELNMSESTVSRRIKSITKKVKKAI